MADCWLCGRGINMVTLYFIYFWMAIVCIFFIGVIFILFCDFAAHELMEKIFNCYLNSIYRRTLNRSQTLEERRQYQNQVPYMANSIVRFSTQTETVAILPVVAE